MSRRGFTLIELMIVLACAAVIAPLVYSFSASVLDQFTLARWHMQATMGVRAVSEDLQLDARLGQAAAGDAVAFASKGCDVRYVVTDDATLVRAAAESCGGTRGLARHVESFLWVDGGIELRFARTLRPDRTRRTTVFLPVRAR